MTGALMFAVYPLSVAHARARLANYDAVSVSNSLLFAYSIGASLSPLLASGTMSLLRNPFGLFALWCLANSVFVFVSGLMKAQAQMALTLTAALSYRNGTRHLIPAMADLRKRPHFQQVRSS